LLNLLKIK